MTASTTITLYYDDVPVRVVVEENGALWFVVNDISDILGYCDPSNPVRHFDSDLIRLRVVKTSAGRRRVRVTTPAGVFGMLFQARYTDTADLRRWLENEVLSIGLKPSAWIQHE